MRAWRESACARKGRAAHESDACQSGLGFLGLGLHVQPGRSVRASTSKRARTKRRPGRHADGERGAWLDSCFDQHSSVSGVT